MKLRAALTAAIVVPSAIALTGAGRPGARRRDRLPGPARHDRGLHRDHHRDRGQRRDRRAPGRAPPTCAPWAATTSSASRAATCTPARATTRSCRPAAAGAFTTVYLFGGNDSYVGGAGTSDVIVDEITLVPRRLRAAAGPWSCTRRPRPAPAPSTSVRRAATSTPSGRSSPRWTWPPRRPASTASSTSRPTGLRNATATGCKVRMKGNDKNNVLDAFGHDVVVSGGDGRRPAAPGRQRLRPRPAQVRALQVGVPRPGRPRPSLRQARRRRADRRHRPRRRQRRRRRRHLPRRGPQELRAVELRVRRRPASRSADRAGRQAARA